MRIETTYGMNPNVSDIEFPMVSAGISVEHRIQEKRGIPLTIVNFRSCAHSTDAGR